MEDKEEKTSLKETFAKFKPKPKEKPKAKANTKPKRIEIKEVPKIYDGLYVYVGAMPIINYHGLIFDRGVPTFVNLGRRELIDEIKDMQKFDGANAIGSNPRPIRVQMPNQFENFLASFLVLERLRYHYPHNPIHCFCNSEWKELIPNIGIYKDKQERGYYRDYNITESKTKDYITTINKSMFPNHELYLKYLGLWKVNKDQEKKLMPYIFPLKNTANSTKYYLGNHPFDDKIRKKYSISLIEIGESINNKDIKYAKGIEYLISTVDDDFTKLCAVLGVRVLLFIEPSIMKRQIQYRCYPNVANVLQLPGTEEETQEAFKLIDDFIK